MDSLKAFIDLAPVIGLGAILMLVVVNGIAIHRASRNINRLHAIVGASAIEVRALTAKVKELESTHSAMALKIEALIDGRHDDWADSTRHVNGSDASICRDEDIPF